MSGDIWKFSDRIDDIDAEMLRHDFITLREGMEYYEDHLDFEFKSGLETEVQM